MSMSIAEALLDCLFADCQRQLWTMLFGDAIRDCRRECGRSIRQAARCGGLDPALWKAIEAGEQAPTPNQVPMLARGLEMAEADLGELVDCCQSMWT